MAEPPSRVTITLGRSGQVVKKAASSIDFSFSDSQPAVGSKRSVKDRLGAGVDSSSQLSNKRQRGDFSSWSSGAASGIDDARLDRGDLRFKIMRKTMPKRNQSNGQQNGMDLRDTLSRSAQSSTTPSNTRHLMPEPKESRLRYPDQWDDRQRTVEGRDGRHHIPESRESSRSLMPDTRDTRQRIPALKDGRYQMPERQSGDIHRQVPPSRNVDSLPSMDSMRGSFSPWTLERLRRRSPDGALSSRGVSPPRRGEELQRSSFSPWTLERLRRRSPDGVLSSRGVSPPRRGEEIQRRSFSPWTLERLRRRSPDGVLSSRGVSPPRRGEEIQRRPTVRAYDDPRLSSYGSKDYSQFSRPMSSTYLSSTALPAAPAKTMVPVHAPIPQPGGLVQKSSYAVENLPTVEAFLHSLGLEKYAINFKAEEVDMHTLRQMGDNDLKELGIPMGPRKKIILSLLSRAKRQL